MCFITVESEVWQKAQVTVKLLKGKTGTISVSTTKPDSHDYFWSARAKLEWHIKHSKVYLLDDGRYIPQCSVAEVSSVVVSDYLREVTKIVSGIFLWKTVIKRYKDEDLTTKLGPTAYTVGP